MLLKNNNLSMLYPLSALTYIWVLFISSYHLSEELNDNQELVSSSLWPKVEENKISKNAEAGEELVKSTMEGMRNVLNLAKLEKPKKFIFFVPEEWTYELFNLVSKEIKVTRNIGEIMKRILEEEKMKMKGKEVSKIVMSLVKDVSKIPSLVTSQKEELAVLKEAKEFLEKEFECKVEILRAEDSQHPKAQSAWPGKVGILVE